MYAEKIQVTSGIFHGIPFKRCIIGRICYMASSMSGQDESNPML